MEEKINKAVIKTEKAEDKAIKKQKKKKDKLIKKAEKERENAQKRLDKKDEKPPEKGGKESKGKFIAGIVSLSLAVVALTAALCFSLFMPNESKLALNNSYRKSYYDTMAYVNNLDLGMGKTLSTKDKESMQKYLVDLTVASELAENDIGRLPLKDESKFYTAKLINQIGDFAKYLNNKLIDGGEISETDIKNLKVLYRANKDLLNALSEMNGSIDENFDFTALAEKDNALLRGMGELQNISVEYPELIYDGPFSDAQSTSKPEEKNLITEEKAREIFIEIFNSYKITDVKSEGETEGKFSCYNFSANSNGVRLFAQITKEGKLSLFDCFKNCNKVNFTEDELKEKAQEFLKTAGYFNMTPVWVSSSNAVATFNFVYEQNGIPIYPDMIKVSVCMETGKVSGIEATSYLLNHKDRKIESAKISVEAAREKLSSSLEVLNERLTVIPKGQKGETLAYEFECKNESGEIYFVYIDAVFGKQAEMFKVIKTGDGEKLI